MTNETVTLLQYAKLPELGWRRGRAVFGKTGKLAPDCMFVGKRNHKRKVHAPEGHHELRYFEGRLPRYKDVGNDPTEALEQLKLAQKQLQLKNSAESSQP